MNNDSLYRVQAEALIRQLTRDQEKRCGEIERNGQEWARQRLAEARHQAVVRFHKAAERERERFRREISGAEAAITAEARNRHQQHLASLVKAVVAGLPAAMEVRWKNPASRAAWIKAALAEAQGRLGTGEWLIRVAESSGDEDLPQVMDGTRLQWRADPELGAGLVIEKGGARLDASVVGLLADTTMLESRILAMRGEKRGGGGA
jgi:vacuolar-type H+-ATPase subunit E/Vma4